MLQLATFFLYAQALTNCGSPNDVLRLLDEFRQRQQQVRACQPQNLIVTLA